MSIHTQLRGTGVALVTPFITNGSIDEDALTKLINHIIEGGAEYLVVLGTTAENATLTYPEKQKVTTHIVKETKNRVPLVLGIGGNDTDKAIKTISKTDLSAFAAILSVSPYYNKPSQEGIYQHYKAIAQSTIKPIILYNVPSRTASNITAETTLRLAHDFRNIIGIKEASGNIEQCMTIIAHKPNPFLVISGDDNLTLPLIACGGDGVISVVANAFPKSFSNMVRAALEGDFDTARTLHYKTFEITKQLFADGNPGGVKIALEILKICGSDVRLPLVKPSIEVQNTLKNLIKG